MKKTDLTEAVDLGKSILAQLRGTVNAAQLTYDCGVLLASLGTQIRTGAIWSGLSTVFEEARTSGATYFKIDRIRVNATAMKPRGRPARLLRDFVIDLCLVELAQILAATAFTSRADIDAALDKIDVAFASAIETASDAFDFVVYRALIALAAACTRDLSNRAQTLPRIVYFEFPLPLPALYLAQRIYNDGSRAEELAAENQARHPLFMESPVRALSA